MRRFYAVIRNRTYNNQRHLLIVEEPADNMKKCLLLFFALCRIS